MALTNIALNKTVLEYSSQFTGRPATKIVDGQLTYIGDSYASGYGQVSNQYVVIDLGAVYTLHSYKLFGVPDSQAVPYCVRDFRIGASAYDYVEVPGLYTPFDIVDAGTMPAFSGSINYISKTFVSPVPARYLKIYLDNNNGGREYLVASDFQVFNNDLGNFTSSLLSSAEISRNTATILSNTTITANYTATITSSVYAKVNEASTKTSSAIIVNKATASIPSNARINANTLTTITSAASIMYTSSRTSTATITRNETISVTSDANILRAEYLTGSANTIILGRATINAWDIRGTYITTTQNTTSIGTVVNDMVTGDPLLTVGQTTPSVLDLATASTPHGYVNYDWAYDWVVKTRNYAQYIFEARQSDSIIDLPALKYSRIVKGQILPRGAVKRYHQWRLHVWASGSGDFELHQFTVKAYTKYPADPLTRAISFESPATTSPIVLEGTAPVPENYSLYTTIYNPPRKGKDLNSSAPISNPLDV